MKSISKTESGMNDLPAKCIQTRSTPHHVHTPKMISTQYQTRRRGWQGFLFTRMKCGHPAFVWYTQNDDVHAKKKKAVGYTPFSFPTGTRTPVFWEFLTFPKFWKLKIRYTNHLYYREFWRIPAFFSVATRGRKRCTYSGVTSDGGGAARHDFPVLLGRLTMAHFSLMCVCEKTCTYIYIYSPSTTVSNDVFFRKRSSSVRM